MGPAGEAHKFFTTDAAFYELEPALYCLGAILFLAFIWWYFFDFKWPDMEI